MMTEENNVGPLATPTRFLYENGQWNLTPSLTTEMNPFDCNFHSPTVLTKEHKWAPVSPKQEPILSPPTPPMSLSQSPTNSSVSLTISPRNSLADIQEEPVARRTMRTTRSKKAKSTDDEEEEYKPKSTGGRKRRIVFEGEDAEERRKKFLERNRVAAYKCRQKKKTWMQELEQRAEMSASRNEELREMVAQLKEESMYLRNLLLSHGNCDCESVQAYLRRTSAQITSNVYPRRESCMLPQPTPYYSSTGLTPFLDTVINKSDKIAPTNMDDYFSQSHTIA
ncbi:hypothetical protein G6F16_003963 [Rhizopus arrhizus]|uniref:BZIP domain-containing protein n=1 Tax=Rhizopus oryzae TaxID=64495 RepID=A0A9P7BSZ5_RHIOR|nr:hypothetical protein G6F23_012493 [Rhizopus arrhizus]KAG0773855.1 hypothetical protein G6F22_014530 [Rhizopus arrhizus]KAG0815744.1 hypothetical protein G6F18_013069 [Rhizopus arrhizus]KAG0818612.1 hypothetical protein G6F20_001423 [Rhizopus arrhizus]KAG0839962.1 hypothetical protein G6F19_002282 [Rhizopus arrhizus]